MCITVVPKGLESVNLQMKEGKLESLTVDFCIPVTCYPIQWPMIQKDLRLAKPLTGFFKTTRHNPKFRHTSTVP